MGLACAKILGRDHQLIICDISQEKLTQAANELKSLGIQCATRVCDITDQQAVQQLFHDAAKMTEQKGAGEGTLRCVVHTAGISPQMADPLTILRVNTLGTIHITEAALALAGPGFALVNVASMAGHLLPNIMIPTRAFRLAFTNQTKFIHKLLFPCQLMPKPLYRNGLAYAISKTFVIWYCKRMAGKFGDRNARILSVSPGSFDTQMGRLEEKSGSADMLENAALKRFGKVEEIAELLAFCASDKASYLTGTDILCDGGVVAARIK